MSFLFIFGAKYLYIVSLLMAIGYFFVISRENKKSFLVLGIISSVLAYAVSLVISHLYFDPRPFVVGHFTPLIPHAADNGFPSDHELLTAVIASVMYLYNRKVSLVLWLIAIAVGISRVYVGIHHPIDIAGSIIIAIGATAFTYFIIKKYARFHF